MLPALTRRVLVASLALPALVRPVRAAPVDPIFAAIERANATDEALAALLTNLNEDGGHREGGETGRLITPPHQRSRLSWQTRQGEAGRPSPSWQTWRGTLPTSLLSHP